MPTFVATGLVAFAGLALPWLALSALGLAVERIAPAEPRQPARAILLNLHYTMLFAFLEAVAGPLIGTISLLLVGALGGGLIVLPDQGWAQIGSLIVFLCAMDFAEYAFHRAQHASRFLWALHSLHHSDTALNVTTTFRHHWLDIVLKGVIVYPCVALIFKAGTETVLVYNIISYWSYFGHANLRISLGPFWAVVNSPPYHRLHHSVLPIHHDRNFAAILPLWDVLFRTCRRPMPGECPPTGLADGAAPATSLAMLTWPLAPRPDPYSTDLAASSEPAMREASEASRKRSRSPSSTAPVLPVSTPVRKSFTI
jgi:sterol desaturase/sphingolipid hydroxylase (fatty acid hydroxylase superfamily)